MAQGLRESSFLEGAKGTAENVQWVGALHSSGRAAAKTAEAARLQGELYQDAPECPGVG